MKIELLIEQLQELQKDHPGINVAVFDWRKSLGDDDGSGTSAGIESDFDIRLISLESDEREFYKEQNDFDFVDWIALSFENEDYDVKGNCVLID